MLIFGYNSCQNSYEVFNHKPPPHKVEAPITNHNRYIAQNAEKCKVVHKISM